MQLNILFLCNCLILKQSEATFIDTKHPILISDKTNANDGKSYFGYSISGYSSNAVNRVSIYIGAPSSVRRSTRGAQLDTGDVWECQVNLKENEDHPKNNGTINCTPWNGLNKASSTGRCCGTQTRCVTEYTSKMWLGGSLTAIDENSFVACGPRWATQNNKDRTLNGFCYRAQNGVGNVHALEPPLQHWDQLTTAGILIWFYGQTGFSLALDNSKTLLLAGSPGFFGWRGNAILYNLDENVQQPQSQSCQAGSQFNTVFKTNSRRTGGDSPDYFGYHVASGQYSVERETVFGIGAPRGHGNSDKHLTGFASVISVKRRNIHGRPLMEIRYAVLGDQLGSYFGAVVAFADINGDGIDDLLVGAPFYTVGHNSESYDEGCVFVYSKEILIEKLCPSSETRSYFGASIANIGDIDQDGITDIAIGAPGFANGMGAVFIYYGHLNSLSSHPNNPHGIMASEIKEMSNLMGFGSTLFGNIDLDGNKTPDLLVGASLSNQIVIYRTRPRLELHPVVTNFHTPTTSQPIYKLKREDMSFRLLFCISSQRLPKNDGKLEIAVEAKFDSSEQRYQFGSMKIYKFFIEVVEDYLPSCRNVLVNRVKEVEAQNPASIRIMWTMKYNNTRSENFDISKLSIVSNGQGRFLPGNSIFCTWCPSSMEQSHEHFLPVATDNCDEDGNELCNSKLKVVANLRPIKGIEDTKLDQYIIGPYGNRFIDVYIENYGETAYLPTMVVNISFSKPIFSNNFILRPAFDGNNRKCHYNNYKVVCRDPLHKGQREHLSFIIVLSQTLTAMQNEENIKISITGYPGPHPEQMTISNLVELKLISDVKLLLTELNSERKDINIFNDPNAVFKSSYEITNSGASPLKDLRMKFQIPVKYESNNEVQDALIVFMPKPYNRVSCIAPNAQGFPSLPTILINNPAQDPPFGNFVNETLGISRRRRQTQENGGKPHNRAEAQSQNSMSTTGNTVEVDCFRFPEWKCIEIDCKLQPVSPLTSAEPLTIDLSLAFTTNVTNSLITSKSTLYVTTSAKIWAFDNDNTDHDASAVTILQAEPYGDLPAYLVFVSGIGGLIVFLLIAFGLFKCGFFRRKTKENLENLKAQAQQADLMTENFGIQPDADEVS